MGISQAQRMSDFNPYQTPPSALDVTAVLPQNREPLNGEGALASRLSRFIASIIDGIALVLALVYVAATGTFDTFLDGEIGFVEDGILTVFAGLIFVRLNARLIAEKGQTIGKKLLAIQVVYRLVSGTLSPGAIRYCCYSQLSRL